MLAGKLEANRADCEAVAGKSTPNRLESHPRAGSSVYHKITLNEDALQRLFVDLFLNSHSQPPVEIVLDPDATDVPLHGEQENRFFHGYYDQYCYLPLYIFCGRQLLCAKSRPANIDGSAGALKELQRIVGQIGTRWPGVRIIQVSEGYDGGKTRGHGGHTFCARSTAGLNARTRVAGAVE